MHIHVSSNIRYTDFKHDIFYIICEMPKLVQINSILLYIPDLAVILDAVTLFRKMQFLQERDGTLWS